jgi:hypothetical protein
MVFCALKRDYEIELFKKGVLRNVELEQHLVGKQHSAGDQGFEVQLHSEKGSGTVVI